MTDQNGILPSKPFLKWAGGKTKVAPHILPHLFGKKRLIEPFAGSCALFLQSSFREALLSDINLDLIHLYNTLKSEGGSFIDYVEREYFRRDSNGVLLKNNVDAYKEMRDRFNELLDAVTSENPDKNAVRERSGLFVYLNRHAFNGICRYNSAGGFNVPYGHYKSVYFPREEMQSFASRARNVEFKHCSFEDTMRAVIDAADENDVIYADPPYIEMSPTAAFKSYAKDGFINALQDKLVELANEARAKGIRTLVSNHDVTPARDLYESGTPLVSSLPLQPADCIKTFKVQRNIAAAGDRRKKVGELLAIYDPNGGSSHESIIESEIRASEIPEITAAE